MIKMRMWVVKKGEGSLREEKDKGGRATESRSSKNKRVGKQQRTVGET